MLSVTIPMPTVSLNVLQRMHFHAIRKLRDQYTVILRARASSLHKAKPGQRRQVRIERRGVRLIDHDNFVGGCKPLVDALGRAELIWDDAPRYLRVEYVQTKTSAKQTCTVVSIV